MEYRRIPFQFSATDPVKRQAELEKRFGLSSAKDKMRVDFMNSGAMGPGNAESNSATKCSPRLQHRVPIFVEGGLVEPSKPSVLSQNNVDDNRKPNMRVVPIEIEGTDTTLKRHKTLSGSGANINGRAPHTGFWFPDESLNTSLVKPLSTNPPIAPRVCNIPIKVEEGYHQKQAKCPTVEHTEKNLKQIGVKKNACNVSISSAEAVKENKPPELDFSIPLKKIENMLEKLKTYAADVEKFSGTAKDKQYRYLDEMLTRCMLDLDDVDTMGNENVRLSRKGAVRKVQQYIDMLESKLINVNQKILAPKSEVMDELSVVNNLATNTLESDADRKIINTDCAMESNEQRIYSYDEIVTEHDVNKTNIKMEGKVVESEKKSDVEMEADAENQIVTVEMKMSDNVPEVDVPIPTSERNEIRIGDCAVRVGGLSQASPGTLKICDHNKYANSSEMECGDECEIEGSKIKENIVLSTTNSPILSSDCRTDSEIFKSQNMCEGQLSIPESTLSVEALNNITHSNDLIENSAELESNECLTINDKADSELERNKS